MEKMQLYLLFTLLIGFLVEGTVAFLNITIPAKLNRAVLLPCVLQTGPVTGINVRWSNVKDGYLTSGSRVYKYKGQISVEKPAPNEWNLQIKKVDMSFEDIYLCKTDSGELISYIRLVIESEPKIQDQQSTPIRATFDENTTAVLKCGASGTPEPKIKWYRMIDSSKPKELGITGPELIIRNITRYAAGEYMCKASNKIGSDDRIMKITVDFPPEVNVIEPEVYASGGEVVVMSCVVQASPLIEAYWTFGTKVDGDTIYNNWKYLVHVEEVKDMPVRFMSLVIRKSILAHKDYGTYMCVAKGKDKVDYARVELKQAITVNADEEKEGVINYN